MAEMEKKILGLQQENARIRKDKPTNPSGHLSSNPSRRPPPPKIQNPPSAPAAHAPSHPNAVGFNSVAVPPHATTTINTGRIIQPKNLEDVEMTKEEKS